LVLLAVVLWLAWSRPVATELDMAAVAPELPAGPASSWALGQARDYQEFNDRPLFNETRRPAVVDEEVPEPEQEVVEVEVSKPPEMRLTGVIITPNQRLAMLTPQGGGEPLVIREGGALEGEFVGWSLNAVAERQVRLESARGDAVKLDLVVHDQAMKEPPKPKQRRASRVVSDPLEEDEAEAGDDVQDLSRAEEIRQRIAERREQLREAADQEEQQAEEQQAERRNAYQDAIRSMMSQGGNENEEDGGEDE
jgi:hypothetical protein